MAVFRVEKTRNYTVMSNHPLRDKSLSLKAKGLLSLMLSLPEEWDYTTKGLAYICKDGVDSIESTGIAEPLIVRPRSGGGYEIISGHRRDYCAKVVGLETRPVIVRDYSDEDADVLVVDYNINRENLLPSEKAKAYKLKLDALVVLGGNGSQKTANLLSKEGLNVVGLPKTIDNDLWGTDMTFGFQSAVDIATNAIDCIHTTASSHGRVFIVEVMGHKVGWLTLHAGIAGGADIILLPEIPYDMDVIAEAIDKRAKSGKKFTIIAVAEGAISKEDAKLSKKELKDKQAKKKYPSVAYEMAEKVQKRTQQEVRIAIPGHTQRGGSPCPFDRVLSTRLGAEAARAILDENYGCMMSVKNDKIVRVPLSEVAGKLKYVDPKSEIIRQAKITGISFGDE